VQVVKELNQVCRGRAMRRIGRYAAVAVITLSAAGCVSSQPSPELLATAMPNPETPPMVTGELYEACKTAARTSKSATVSPQATFDSNYTYAMAKRIKQLQDPAAAGYALRVRAYVAHGSGTNLLGFKKSGKLGCFYELNNGQLRFLSAVTADQEDRTRREDFTRAVMKAYTVLSGKDPTQVLLFGAYAK